jgi:hypothetical protein
MNYFLKPDGVLAAAMLFAVAGQGQTQLDLRRQIRNVDFSSAPLTRPFQTGSSLPSNCTAGETYFKLNAPAGENFYGCASPGIWSLQGQRNPVPSFTGAAETLLWSDGIALRWQSVGGDVSGSAGSLLVTGLRGRSVANTAPVNGQLLRWQNGSWSPAAESITSIFGRSGTVTAQNGDYAFSQISGIASLLQGGTGASTASAARANLGAAAALHTHLISDLQGIAGKQGNGSALQMYGGGTTTAGDCATFDANGNVVSTGTPCLASTDNYFQPFTAALSVMLNHNLKTTHIVVQCYSGNAGIEYDALTVVDSNSAVVGFAAPQSGACIVNGSSAGPGNGAVTNTGALTLDTPLFGAGGIAVKAGTRTGTGTEAVMSQSPTIVTPTITSFVSASHNHADAAGGGQLDTTAIRSDALNGNGTKLQLFGGGPPAENDCAKFDSNGNLVSAGAACGSASAAYQIQVGGGLSGDGSRGSPLILDPASVPTRLSATATLTFPSMAQSTCNEQVITLTGAATGDEVMIGAPANIDQGFLWSAYVSIADTVKVRLCKITNGTVTPVVGVWRATIVRSF